MFVKVISATLITASAITLVSPPAHACWICDPIGETRKTFKNPKKGLKNLGTGITDGLKKTRDVVGKGAVVIFSGAGKQVLSGRGGGQFPGRDGDDLRITDPDPLSEEGDDSLILPYQTTGSF